MSDKRREYLKNYFREIRLIIMEQHEYVSQTHCWACNNAYHLDRWHRRHDSKLVDRVADTAA